MAAAATTTTAAVLTNAKYQLLKSVVSRLCTLIPWSKLLTRPLQPTSQLLYTHSIFTKKEFLSLKQDFERKKFEIKDIYDYYYYYYYY